MSSRSRCLPTFRLFIDLLGSVTCGFDWFTLLYVPSCFLMLPLIDNISQKVLGIVTYELSVTVGKSQWSEILPIQIQFEKSWDFLIAQI